KFRARPRSSRIVRQNRHPPRPALPRHQSWRVRHSDPHLQPLHEVLAERSLSRQDRGWHQLSTGIIRLTPIDLSGKSCAAGQPNRQRPDGRVRSVDRGAALHGVREAYFLMLGSSKAEYEKFAAARRLRRQQESETTIIKLKKAEKEIGK